MIALEISVNGRHVQTASCGEFGSIEAEVMWMRFPQEGLKLSRFHNHGRVWSHGMRRDDQGATRYESLRWPHTEIKVGDVVTIRVVEVDVATGDEPAYRKMRGVDYEGNKNDTLVNPASGWSCFAKRNSRVSSLPDNRPKWLGRLGTAFAGMVTAA